MHLPNVVSLHTLDSSGNDDSRTNTKDETRSVLAGGLPLPTNSSFPTRLAETEDRTTFHVLTYVVFR